MNEPKHPIQPLEYDCHSILRFKQNKIVRSLLDEGPCDTNDLAKKSFSDEDREQFAQLIGYSHSGASDLSYVSDYAWENAKLTKSNAHPVQPLVPDADGDLVFKENKIITFLCNKGGYSVYALAKAGASVEDLAQLVQLLSFTYNGHYASVYLSDSVRAKALEDYRRACEPVKEPPVSVDKADIKKESTAPKLKLNNVCRLRWDKDDDRRHITWMYDDGLHYVYSCDIAVPANRVKAFEKEMHLSDKKDD